MRKFPLVVAFVLISLNLHAQNNDLSGSWSGSLDVMGQKLPLLFNFEKTEEGWRGTADSPMQGAKGMLLKNVLFNGLMVSWEFVQIPALYEGVMLGDSLKGNFTQSGTVFPLNLGRATASDTLAMERPQEPSPPFDYEEIATSFGSADNQIMLTGTITKPKGPGPFPSVVLVSGSGPQNRNGEIFGHQPFWVIADYLTSNGILVFRYDERGVGDSEGDFAKATSYDLKEDAANAVAHLRKFPFVDQSQVGIIGHSEGGMIGWMLAAAETNLNFLVALAGPVVPVDEFLEQQTLDVLKSVGASQEWIDQRLTLNKKVYNTVKNTEQFSELEGNLEKMVQEHLASLGVDESSLEAETSAIMKAFGPSVTPWFFEFLKFSSQPFIEQIRIPVFAAFATKDIQVNASANAKALRAMTDQNDLFEIFIYPGLNHLFQATETGELSEYAFNPETFNETVLEDMVNWIKSVKRGM